jgi:hypothetical protein
VGNGDKKFVPGIRILLLYGKGYSGITDGIGSEINGKLEFDHEVFDESDENTARTIVITSLDTLARRNGPDNIITDEVWLPSSLSLVATVARRRYTTMSPIIGVVGVSSFLGRLLGVFSISLNAGPCISTATSHAFRSKTDE